MIYVLVYLPRRERWKTRTKTIGPLIPPNENQVDKLYKEKQKAKKTMQSYENDAFDNQGTFSQGFNNVASTFEDEDVIANIDPENYFTRELNV